MNKPVVILVIILAPPILAWSETASWTGKVVGINDDDTITVMHHDKGEKIHLYRIDCLEKRHAYDFRDMECFKLKIYALPETKYASVG